ncbi:MAG: RNA methyltransferase [Candidatus Cloacimonas sp.]|jgi:tRNA/rRNA methyltransferase|nr:RNA methyltransferase [Candidatus Cloacimonadota bacterium]
MSALSIIFVLVEPVYRGNIGACARVVNNFGFDQLRLVGTIPQKEDHYLAVHSEEVMEKIVVYDSLSEAVEDCDLTIGLTRRFGRKKRKDLDVSEVGSFVTQFPRKRVAFVFGRETCGLKDDEIDLCQIRCHIPTSDKFPSLNLAQAVAIVAYELYQASIEGDLEKRYLSGTEEIKGVVDSIVDNLSGIKYFENGDPEVFRKKLENILFKSYVSPENLHFIEKVFSRIEFLNNRTERVPDQNT